MAITPKPWPIIRHSSARAVRVAGWDDTPALSVTAGDLCDGLMRRCRGGIAEFMLVYSSDSIECFAAMRVSKCTVTNGLRYP